MSRRELESLLGRDERSRAREDADARGARGVDGASTPFGGFVDDAARNGERRAEDGGRAYEGTLCGRAVPESAAFAIASALCVMFIGASCYFEEYMYRSLPSFDYYWTVALAELLVFTLISSASSMAWGGAVRGRKAPLELYFAQAVLLAAYSATGKLCYKWINYATGTVLRSSKLVFTMGISAVWLKRRYRTHQMMAALLLVVAVAFFGFAEHQVGQNAGVAVLSEAEGDEMSVEDMQLGADAKFALGFGLSVLAIFLGSLQSNVSEHAMRNYGASVEENILYSNAIGTIFAFVAVALIEGTESLRYIRRTPGAFSLLLARSVTFYFGAYMFSVIAKHFGATAATAVSTIRKALTVIVSFVAFPADKPFAGYFVYGLLIFLLSVVVESSQLIRECFERVAKARRGGYARDESV